MLAKLCRGLGYMLLVVGGSVVLLGLVGIYMEQGWSGIQEMQSPRNIWYYATIIVLLAPGVWLIMLGDKLSRR